jgi:hypothetical protein
MTAEALRDVYGAMETNDDGGIAQVDKRQPIIASSRAFLILRMVNVEEIKTSIASLSAAEQSEVCAFLFHLRHASDPECQERVDSRLSDKESFALADSRGF